MTKMTYETPVSEIVEMTAEDVIRTSGGSGKPGNGWGDKNHDHEGPPGQKK